jgi:glycosyltransferase 2 family protein
MKARSVAIGLLISAFFLYLALRKVDLHEVSAHLLAANYWYLIPASALTIFAFWVRAVRWGLLLHPLKPIKLGPLFSATMIGFMCNNILPMRLGEFVRAWVIGRSAHVRASAAFATIIIERLFDLFSMAGIFGLILIFAPFENRPFKMGVLLALLFGAGVLGALLLLHWRGRSFGALAERFVPRALRPRVTALFESFQSGLGIFRDPRRLVLIGLLTFAMWFCFAIVIRMCFASARLETGAMQLPPLASLVVLVVIAIGIMVPSGPGFVGTLQAAAVLGLAIVGYRDQSRAITFSIIYHVTQWFPVVFVGMIYMTKENLSLSQVGRLRGADTLAAEGQAGESGGDGRTAP